MMKSFRSLTNVFFKSTKMDKPKDKATKMKVLILSIFAIFCIMIPVTVGIGLITNLATQSLSETGNIGFGLYLMWAVIIIFTVIFGMNVIFNELYFSNDIEYLMPLPLRGFEITGAKFMAVFKTENFMQFLFVLACVIGYGTAAKAGILGWIFALVGGFLLPIVPMAYCAILGILIMSFTRIVKSKDTVRRISMILMLIILVSMGLMLGSVKNADLENYILGLANADLPFMKVVNIIFPQLMMLIKAISEGSILQFIFFLLYNAVVVAIFLVISEALYIKSVTQLGNEANSGRKNRKEVEAFCKSSSQGYAYFKKDLKMLARTPVYFTNCIAISFIWPLFVYIATKLKDTDIHAAALHELYTKDNGMFPIIVLIFVMAISIIMTAMNSLGSNAFSREGKHFDFIKYIPVPVSVQWNAKAMVSVVLSTISVVVFFIIFGIYAALPILHIIINVLISFLACVVITYLGMLMDSMRPKLVWDDELASLRENENTFFNMAVSIGIAAAIGVCQFVLHRFVGLSIVIVGLITIAALAIAAFVLYKRSMTKGIENIMNFEDLS